jgi:hypothetical protein
MPSGAAHSIKVRNDPVALIQLKQAVPRLRALLFA